MPATIEIAETKSFFRATAYGVHDMPQAKQALARLAEMVASQSGGLLVDVREAASYLSLTEIREILDEFVRLRISEGRKTAVLAPESRYDNVQFFAVSARGMGLDVQAFTSFEDACDWLTL
jgi:hypothetical protein